MAKYLRDTKPNPFQPLVDAINASTVKMEFTLDKETKKVIYTAFGALSAAIVVSAVINYKSRR